MSQDEYYAVLTPLSTVFKLQRGCQFYLWKKPEYLEKTTDLSQVTDKPEIMEHQLNWNCVKGVGHVFFRKSAFMKKKEYSDPYHLIDLFIYLFSQLVYSS